MAMRKTYRKTRRASYPRRKSAHRAVRPWSREEIAFMRKYYRKFETSWIARQLGRTVYSVRYKAVDLSIRKASPSVWKGNKGSANAFRRTQPKRAKTTTRRRVTKTRRTTSNRRYRATNKRRVTRKATPRRRNRR